MTGGLFTMRAPNGETADVSPDEVDFFRKKGAVLVGPAGQAMQPVASHAQPVQPMQPVSTHEPPAGPGLAVSHTSPEEAPMQPVASHDSRPALVKFWEWANTPLVDFPKLEVSEEEMAEIGQALSQNPGAQSALKAALGLGKQIVNIGSDMAEGVFSPAGLASAALSGGGYAAGRAGYMGIGAAARAAEAALSVPYIAEGAHNIATAENPGQALGGAIQAGLGAYGVGSALSTKGFTPVRYGKDELFEREVAANSAGASLTQTPPQTLLQRRSGDRVFYGLTPRAEGGVEAGALMNNQPGYKGAIKEAFPDMAERGATHADAWAVKSEKFPEGMLPTLYKRQGWEVYKTEAYDVAKYGEPPESLKASWRSQGWKDGDPIPEVAFLRRPGLPEQSGSISAIPGGQGAEGVASSTAVDAAGAVSSPAQPTRGGRGASTAAAIVGPAAAGAVPDDPESRWDDYLRLALNAGGLVGLGMAARTFDPKLLGVLDEAKASYIAREKARYIKAGGKAEDFKVKDSPLGTHLRNVIRDYMGGGTRRSVNQVIDAYETVPLPVKHGIDWDVRKPLEEVLDHDLPGTSMTTKDRTARGAKFSETTQKRMDVAFEQGQERAKDERWGDPRYLYNLSNGNPRIASRLARMFGSFSPGQKTDANAFQGVEAWIRSAMGETPEQILGKEIIDPADASSTIRVGGSMSYKHVRPGTVEDNLMRVMQDGRIFREKVEALAAAEVGITDKIPIDMWLMRALGASSDVTPNSSFYRLISEAVTKEAIKRGESPFSYMAKVWMGMQKIAGAETPSFEGAISRMRLEEPIASKAMQQRFLADPEKYATAIRNKSASEVGEVFPIATNPEMSYENFVKELHQHFKAGTGSDVLGKVKVVKNPKPTTLADLQLEAKADDMGDLLTKRPGKGPGQYILHPDGTTTEWLPFRGFTASGKPRPYKKPKGSAVIKNYPPKAPKEAPKE